MVELMDKKTSRNTIYLTLISIFIASAMIFVAALPVHAGYYGGSIQNVTYCTCYYDFGVMLDIKDLASHKTIKVFYNPFYSLLRANYNIWEAGPNVIGGYTEGSKTCQTTSGYTCSSQGNADGIIDLIIGIGSSSN